MPIELTQADVDALFDIERGGLMAVDPKLAGRLVMLGYLAPAEKELAQLASTRTQAHGRNIPLALTSSAKRLLASVRDGSNKRWVAQ